MTAWARCKTGIDIAGALEIPQFCKISFRNTVEIPQSYTISISFGDTARGDEIVVSTMSLYKS